MYNAFFGLGADPFRVNPDPRFLFLSDGHKEALATLVYAVRERKGFIVLTGEVGTGKTTVLNALLRRLDPKAVQTAYIFNTALETPDFFAYVFDELGLPPVDPFRKSTVLRQLNAYLIDRLRKNLRTLLIIDEAQNLSDELLEEIRMLSNLETPQSKLIQIVLVGQPELADKLDQPKLRQLRQRVELRHDIAALGVDETAAYVADRLRTAGHPTGDLFTTSALRAVYSASSGIPRVINVLCDNALVLAFSKQSTRVSAQMVHESAKDMALIDDDTDFGGPLIDGPNDLPRPQKRWLRRLWPRRRAAVAPQL